jgi:hypothetical protein
MVRPNTRPNPTDIDPELHSERKSEGFVEIVFDNKPVQEIWSFRKVH